MNIKIEYPIKRSGVDYVSYDCTLEIKSQYNISEIIYRLTEHVNFDGAILSVSMVKSASADKLLRSLPRPKSNKEVFIKTFQDRITHLNDSFLTDYVLVFSLLIPKSEIEKDEVNRKTIESLWSDLASRYRGRQASDSRFASGNDSEYAELATAEAVVITPKTANPKQVSAVDFLSSIEGAAVLTQSFFFDRAYREYVDRHALLQNTIFSFIHNIAFSNSFIAGIENEWRDGHRIVRSVIFATTTDDKTKLNTRVKEYFSEGDYFISDTYSKKATNKLGCISSAWSNRYIDFNLPYKGNSRSGLVLSSQGGQLSFFDMFNSHSNYNVAIAGSPGSGTCHTVKEIMFSHLAGDGYCWCVDGGGSFEQFNTLVGGRRWDVLSEGGINPFSLITPEDNYDYDLTLHWLKRFMFRLCDADEKDRQDLFSKIDEVCFNKRNEATISDLMALLSDNSCKHLADSLAPYAKGGELEWCFKNQIDQVPNDCLVLFDLPWQAPKKIIVSINAVLLRAFQYKILNGPRKRRSLIVQFDFPAIFQEEHSCEEIEELMRRCRKCGASTVIVAPSLMELFSNRVAMSVFYNSSFMIIQPQHNSDVYENSHVMNTLNLSESDKAMLKASRVVPGQYIDICLLGCGQPGFARFNTDPVINSLYAYGSSKPEEIYE